MKTAAYICAGCGVGDVLDVKQLAKVAQREGKMALVREHAMLCSQEGVQQTRDDLAQEEVTHVMLAACSRRAKAEAFHFSDAAVARANLREGVLWIVAQGQAHDEVRQEMADDYVRMGCAELKKLKVTCCGGVLAFSEPEKSQKQIRDIVEAAYDVGADMIVTPCPLCQANVEVYHSEINRKQGTKLNMPVTYYSQLTTVAYGGGIKGAGLDGHLIQPKPLQDLVRRK